MTHTCPIFHQNYFDLLKQMDFLCYHGFSDTLEDLSVKETLDTSIEGNVRLNLNCNLSIYWLVILEVKVGNIMHA